MSAIISIILSNHRIQGNQFSHFVHCLSFYFFPFLLSLSFFRWIRKTTADADGVSVTPAVINKAVFVVFCRRPRHAVTRVEFLRPSPCTPDYKTLFVSAVQAAQPMRTNVNILGSPRTTSRREGGEERERERDIFALHRITEVHRV